MFNYLLVSSILLYLVDLLCIISTILSSISVRLDVKEVASFIVFGILGRDTSRNQVFIICISLTLVWKSLMQYLVVLFAHIC